MPEVVEQFFVEAAPECGLRPKQTAKGSHVYRIGKVARKIAHSAWEESWEMIL